jgi:ElaB/YqjD/DUF883 family membrane-anchored ribosome-binding protein
MDNKSTDITIPSLLDELTHKPAVSELEQLQNEFTYVAIDKKNQFEEEVKEIWADIENLIAKKGSFVKGTQLYQRVESHGMLDAVNARLMRASTEARFVSLLAGELTNSRLSFLS